MTTRQSWWTDFRLSRWLDRLRLHPLLFDRILGYGTIVAHLVGPPENLRTFVNGLELEGWRVEMEDTEARLIRSGPFARGYQPVERTATMLERRNARLNTGIQVTLAREASEPYQVSEMFVLEGVTKEGKEWCKRNRSTRVLAKNQIAARGILAQNDAIPSRGVNLRPRYKTFDDTPMSLFTVVTATAFLLDVFSELGPSQDVRTRTLMILTPIAIASITLAHATRRHREKRGVYADSLAIQRLDQTAVLISMSMIWLSFTGWSWISVPFQSGPPLWTTFILTLFVMLAPLVVTSLLGLLRPPSSWRKPAIVLRIGVGLTLFVTLYVEVLQFTFARGLGIYPTELTLHWVSKIRLAAIPLTGALIVAVFWMACSLFLWRASQSELVWALTVATVGLIGLILVSGLQSSDVNATKVSSGVVDSHWIPTTHWACLIGLPPDSGVDPATPSLLIGDDEGILVIVPAGSASGGVLSMPRGDLMLRSSPGPEQPC